MPEPPSRSESLAPRCCGAFRTTRRIGDHHEVLFRHNRNEMSIAIAYGLDRPAAEKLQMDLNEVLFRHVPKINSQDVVPSQDG